MARGSRLQRGTIGNRSEASRWNFVETSWQLRNEWSRICTMYVKTIKVLNSGSVLIVFNSSLTSDTSIATRSTYFILWVIFAGSVQTFRFSAKNDWAPPDFVAATEFCKSSKKI
jgi:hypothetical protein